MRSFVIDAKENVCLFFFLANQLLTVCALATCFPQPIGNAIKTDNKYLFEASNPDTGILCIKQK